jgi:hypothetical protein
LRHCATNCKVAVSISDVVIGNFHCHNAYGSIVALGFDSASKRNKYQEYFLMVKAAAE